MPSNKSHTKELNFLTIVPARGGSKGVFRKNIRNVGDRPLIEWTIEAIQKSYLKDNFYISTEDKEIANISRKMNAKIIERPENIAADSSQAIDVIHHAVSYAENINNIKYDYIILLQPTSPMRSYIDINNAIDILIDKRPDSLVSVYKVEDAHPARMYELQNDYLEPLVNEGTSTRRQDLSDIFHRNGAIYATSSKTLNTNNKIVAGKVSPLIMPKNRSINIDDEEDLMIADYLISQLNNA